MLRVRMFIGIHWFKIKGLKLSLALNLKMIAIRLKYLTMNQTRKDMNHC